MRALILLLVLAGAPSAWAEEPLLLRIRPANSQPAEIGSGHATVSPDEAARLAFAAREAVWERSRVRAAIAIASICRGCLKGPAPPATAIEPRAESPPRTAASQ